MNTQRFVGAIVVKAAAALAAGAIVLTGCSLLPQLGGTVQEPDTRPAAPNVSGGLAAFQSQNLEWSSCADGMECARVTAPLDWSDLGGATIELQLVKQPATGTNALGTLFVNPGGPGASGVDFIADSIDYAVGKPLQETFDVIGWDPRGVGRSSAVACLDAAGMDELLFGLDDTSLVRGSDAWLGASTMSGASLGLTCLENTGPLLGHVGTDSTIQDLDLMRAIVGDERLNYLGYSYGTLIGAQYAEMFPERVGRMVLDGAIDPTTTEFEVVLEQTKGFEAATRAYLSECLTRTDCPFEGTVDDAMVQIGAQLEALEVAPLTASDGRAVGSGAMLTAILTPLYSQGNWPYLDQLFLSVRAGDADVALELADSYYSRDPDGSYANNMNEAFFATNCSDYPRGTDFDLMRQQAAVLAEAAPTFGPFQGYGETFCMLWPSPAPSERGPIAATGAAPIMVVGTTGDPATPYRWAVALSEQLESGVLVTYEGEGHTAYTGGNACVDSAVENYLLTGSVPATDPRCR
jgi:pimeloyl-ACP methyl ester carboxylesterase